MNKFSRVFHHISTDDVKNTRLKKLAEEKRKEDKLEEDKVYISSIMKNIKSDWKSGRSAGDIIDEGMTQAATMSYQFAAMGDVDLLSVDASVATGFGDDTDGDNNFYSSEDEANLGFYGGVAIVPSGTGTGEDGGFDLGQDYLRFAGDESWNIRWAVLKPIDSSALDTIKLTAIRGNDTNGGEDPDEAGEELQVWYYNTQKTGQWGWTPLNQKPNGTVDSSVSKTIIPLGTDTADLRDWILSIPEWARGTNTRFMFYQPTSSGSGYDHYGITKIGFQRRTPLNVVVPLDQDAGSFVRLGDGPEKTSPKKRKKRVEDMLKASKDYTNKVMGENFPGSGAKVGEAQGTGQPYIQKTYDDLKNVYQDAGSLDKQVHSFLNQNTFEGDPKLDNISVGGKKSGAVLGPDAQSMHIIDDETRETLKAQGFSDKDIDRVLDAGGAEDLRAFAAGDVLPGTMSGTEVAGVNWNLWNWIDKTYGSGASNWYKESGGKTDGNPFIPPGSYVPKADAGGSPEEQIAQLPPEEQIAQAEKEAELTDQEREELKNQGKSEEEIKQEEEKKKNGVLDRVGNALLNKGLDFFKNVDPLDAPIDAVLDLFSGLINGYNAIGNLFGFTGYEKMLNNIEIMRSNLTGRITSYNFGSTQMNSLIGSLTADKFSIPKSALYTSDIGYGISDERHEYADDNIKVINGVVSRNDGKYRTHQPLASIGTGVPSVDGIGKGYGQLIIPKDGSTPYFHYYDYNYNNLNSPDSGEVPGLVNQMGAFVANQLRRILPGRLSDDGINQLQGNINTWGNNLKERVGLDGWSPGIHGATLTDFKINLSQLPQDTQDMIINHPLYQTDARLDPIVATHQDWSGNGALDAEYFRMAELDEKLLSDVDLKLYNSRETKPLRELNDKYFDAWDKNWEERDAVEGSWHEAYYEYNTAEWGGYTDMDPNSPTYNEWIEGESFSDKSEEEQYKLVGVSYSAHQAAEKSAGFDSSGEMANYRQILDGEEGLTGAAGKASDAVRHYKDVKGKLAGGRRMTSDKEKYDEWVWAEKEYPKAMAAAESAFNEWETEITKWQDMYDQFREGKGKYMEKLESDYDQARIDSEKALEKYDADWEVEEQKWKDELDPYWRKYFKSLIRNFSTEYTKGNKVPIDSWIPKGSKAKRPSSPSSRGGLGSVASVGGVSASDAATLAAKKKKNYWSSYELPGTMIQETTFNKIKKLRKKWDYEGKPTPTEDGLPENPPPEIDPQTGFHPQYGKKASRFKKLDPISAKSMPPTGDPDIDVEVKKARKKPK